MSQIALSKAICLFKNPHHLLSQIECAIEENGLYFRILRVIVGKLITHFTQGKPLLRRANGTDSA